MHAITAAEIPHSWDVEHWPANVYPCRSSKGRYVLRQHREELIAAGVLSRVGRDLVILGAAYAAWLAKHRQSVEGFEIAPNRSASAAQVAA
jgi:hypothetical protein